MDGRRDEARRSKFSKAILDADQRERLPGTLRSCVRFALRKRGVEERGIQPLVQAVDIHLAQFAEAFDDESSWGPAKEMATELEARGIDLSGRDAAGDALWQLSAERLARRLLGE